MADVKRRIAVTGLALAGLLLAGCATATSGLRRASESFKAGDYEKTIRMLQEELRAHPNRAEVRTLLFRAQLNQYYLLLAKARDSRRREDRAAAARHYAAALAVFPGNTTLQREADEYLNPSKPAPKAAPESAIQPPVSLDIRERDRVSIQLRNTPVTSIYQTLGKMYGVNFIFDRDFRDFPHSISMDNSTFYEILRVLCMVSSSQYRVLDKRTLVVYPDIFNKKRTYDLRGIQAFYLANIKAEDARKLLQTMFRDEQLVIQEEPLLNVLMVRGEISALKDAERFLQRIDKPRSEVELQIEILEINRNLIRSLGADIANGAVGFSAGALGDDGKVDPLVNLDALKGTNFYMTIPTVTMNILETDDDSKIIAKPNLRGLDGEEISFQVGEEVPVPDTQFASIAAGGINSTPVTTYKYRKVGVEVKVTPTVHSDGDVTLKTKMTFNFIAGSGVSESFPIFGNREIENKIRLKEGETNLIGGLVRDEERRALSGVPGLSKLPIIGLLFASDSKKVNQTDLIFSITPRLIRRAPVASADQETIWSGTPQAAGGAAQPAAPPSGRPAEPVTEADGGEEEAPADEQAPSTETASAAILTVSPRETRVPLNAEAYLVLQLRSRAPLASLSLSGSIQGENCQIVDVKSDGLNENEVKVLKNASGSRFDAGYTFVRPDESRATSLPLLQLRVKFLAKGRYTLAIDQCSGFDSRRGALPIRAVGASIEVY